MKYVQQWTITAILNWESKVIRDCVSFPYLALRLVQKTCIPLSTNQVQTKTNRDLVARVFPRFRQFGCFNF